MNQEKQPEALRLAECLDDVDFVMRSQLKDAATELRRLHAENEQIKSVSIWPVKPLKLVQITLWDGTSAALVPERAYFDAWLMQQLQNENVQLNAANEKLLTALQTIRDYVVTMKGMGHEYQVLIDDALSASKPG